MTMPEKKYILSNLTKRNKVLECSSYNNILKSANKMSVSVTCIACKLKSDEAAIGPFLCVILNFVCCRLLNNAASGA